MNHTISSPGPLKDRPWNESSIIGLGGLGHIGVKITHIIVLSPPWSADPLTTQYKENFIFSIR
jgi:hypothetical protein